MEGGRSRLVEEGREIFVEGGGGEYRIKYVVEALFFQS